VNLPDSSGKIKVEERRATSRYNLALLVEIRVAPHTAAVGTVLAETQDISAQGFYFNVAQKFTVGTQFEFSITLPIDGANQVSVRGKARPVRVEEAGESQAGWSELVPSSKATKSAESP
jgi:PilZ domain